MPAQALTPPARHEIIIGLRQSRTIETYQESRFLSSTFTIHKTLSKHRPLRRDAGDVKDVKEFDSLLNRSRNIKTNKNKKNSSFLKI